MKIGFIGLGIMGSRIANNLLNAGYKVNVFDINDESFSLCESCKNLMQIEGEIKVDKENCYRCKNWK